MRISNEPNENMSPSAAFLSVPTYSAKGAILSDRKMNMRQNGVGEGSGMKLRADLDPLSPNQRLDCHLADEPSNSMASFSFDTAVNHATAHLV